MLQKWANVFARAKKRSVPAASDAFCAADRVLMLSFPEFYNHKEYNLKKGNFHFPIAFQLLVFRLHLSSFLLGFGKCTTYGYDNS